MAQGLGDQLAVASLPAGPGGPAKPMLGYDGYFISAESRHKEAALMAALFLTSQNSQRKMMEAAGHIPSRDDVEITNPLTRQVLEAINRGNTLRPQNPEFNKYWAFFCDTKAIYENNTPIEDWLNAATNNANK
jgi:maltose-binding protein MalE